MAQGLAAIDPEAADVAAEDDNALSALDKGHASTAPPDSGLTIVAKAKAGDTPLEQMSDAQTEAYDRMNKLDAVLQQRTKALSAVPWAGIAAGFLNPGRTGSFSEGLGHAMGNWQDYINKQNEAIPAIAKQAGETYGQIANQAGNKFAFQTAVNDASHPGIGAPGGASSHTGFTPQFSPLVEGASPIAASAMKAQRENYGLMANSGEMKSAWQSDAQQDVTMPQAAWTQLAYAPDLAARAKILESYGYHVKNAPALSQKATENAAAGVAAPITSAGGATQPAATTTSAGGATQPAATTAPAQQPQRQLAEPGVYNYETGRYDQPTNQVQVNANAAIDQAKGVKSAEQDAKLLSDYTDSLGPSRTMMSLTTQYRQLMEQNPKQVAAAYGVLNQPGIGAAIGTILHSGAHAGPLSVDVPGIEDVLRKNNVDPSIIPVIDQLVHLQSAMQTTLANPSVTDHYRTTLGNALPSLSDTYQGAWAKNQEVYARNKLYYDQGIGMQQRGGAMPHEFVGSKAWQKTYDDYDSFMQPHRAATPTPAAPPPQPGAAPAPNGVQPRLSAAQSLRSVLEARKKAQNGVQP